MKDTWTLTGMLTLVLLLRGCSLFDKSIVPICPVDISNLSLNDPQRITGSWRWIASRSDDCKEFIDRPVGLRLLITQDSVYWTDEFENSETRSYALTMRETNLKDGRYFLSFDEAVVFLTDGDTLLVDNRHRDRSQGLFIRE